MVKKKVRDMNWCLIKHKWGNKLEDIFYERISGVSFFTKGTTVQTKVRLCKRCHKKQRIGISGYWIDCDLTKEEEREIKLKDIGV